MNLGRYSFLATVLFCAGVPLLLEYLLTGKLDSQAEEVIKAYQEAFQHGTPHQRDSALGQLKFLRDASPKDAPALQLVLDKLS